MSDVSLSVLFPWKRNIKDVYYNVDSEMNRASIDTQHK